MSLSSRTGGLPRNIWQSLLHQAKHFDARNKLHALLLGLQWKQWLVLFTMGTLIIVIELRNHSRMWQEHGSGQTVWTDSELIWEVLVYGMLMPILVGIILAHMSRTAAERDKVAKELELRRELVDRVSKAQSWHELAEYVVTTPGTILPAEHAWLFAQQNGMEAFEQLAHWERPGSSVLPISMSKMSVVCTPCLEEQAQNGKRLWRCPDPELGGEAQVNRYCLCLTAETTRKTALLFEVPADRPMEATEMHVLEGLGAEMALAIDKANLHILTRQQDDIAKDERMRIARDLHDTVGQNVTYLRLKLEQLGTSQVTSDGGEFQDALGNMLTVANETYVQVRDTLDALRGNEYGPVEEAIRQYALQCGKRSGFQVHINATGPARNLSNQQRRQIAYIAREALNNIEKHSAAKNVDILLSWQGSEFCLTVRDDGQGFDPAEPDSDGGYGLTIMEERSRAIDAELTIRSNPGDGTEVTLRFLMQQNTPSARTDQAKLLV